ADPVQLQGRHFPPWPPGESGGAGRRRDRGALMMQQPNFGQGGSTATQVIGALKRHRWLAAVLFAGAFAAIAGVATALPDYYRATASIFISQDEAPASVRSSVSDELEPRLYAITQEVTSRDNLARLIDEHGLYARERAAGADMTTLVDRMRRDGQLERE